MRISARKKTGMVLVVLVLILAGITDIVLGKTGHGIGLLGGAIGVGIVSWRNINKIRKLEQQGINPYDERVMQVAGLAAQGAIKLLAVGLALFVGLGAIMGPIVRVNPYNFAGYLLAVLLLLYVGLFVYHNRRL